MNDVIGLFFIVCKRLGYGWFFVFVFKWFFLGWCIVFDVGEMFFVVCVRYGWIWLFLVYLKEIWIVLLVLMFCMGGNKDGYLCLFCGLFLNVLFIVLDIIELFVLVFNVIEW